MQIFIGGLPVAVTDEQLHEFACQAAEVRSACRMLKMRGADDDAVQVHSCTALRDPAMPSQNRG